MDYRQSPVAIGGSRQWEAASVVVGGGSKKEQEKN